MPEENHTDSSDLNNSMLTKPVTRPVIQENKFWDYISRWWGLLAAYVFFAFLVSLLFAASMSSPAYRGKSIFFKPFLYVLMYFGMGFSLLLELLFYRIFHSFKPLLYIMGIIFYALFFSAYTYILIWRYKKGIVLKKTIVIVLVLFFLSAFGLTLGISFYA